MDRNEAIEIYKEKTARFKNTQSIQWKMNLSAWTLLLLAIHNKADIFVTDCQWPCIHFPSLLIVVIPVIHLVYCYMTQLSLDFDKAACSHILEQLNISEATNITLIKDDLKIFISRNGVIWIVLQSLMTFILFIVFLITS